MIRTQMENTLDHKMVAVAWDAYTIPPPVTVTTKSMEIFFV